MAEIAEDAQIARAEDVGGGAGPLEMLDDGASARIEAELIALQRERLPRGLNAWVPAI